MASRAADKAAARHARLAAEQAAAAKAARRRRVGIICGVVVVAVIVAVLAAVVSSSGVTPGGIQTGTTATATERTVADELRGIPQHGTTLGRSSARVTIQDFGDLECPVCAALTLGEGGGGLPELIQGPVRDGQVKLQYRSLETASFHHNNGRFVPQQVAAYAAGTQERFWNYAELFYHEQGSEDSSYVTEGYLEHLARQIPGLNFAEWMTARRDAGLQHQIQADQRAATRDGFDSTPSLVAIGPKGADPVSALSGIPSYAEIMSAVTAVA